MKNITFFIKFLLFLLLLGRCLNLQHSDNNQNNGTKNLSNLNQNSLNLDFSLLRRETSKDCNSKLIKIRIFEHKITISKSYGGFKAGENEFFEIQTDDETEKRILDFINKKKLNANIEEIRSTDGIGISGELYFEIFGSVASKIFIRGRTNIWGIDEYVQETSGYKYGETRTNIENIEYFAKADAFVNFITNLGG